jgi:hypothetical protein
LGKAWAKLGNNTIAPGRDKTSVKDKRQRQEKKEEKRRSNPDKKRRHLIFSVAAALPSH